MSKELGDKFDSSPYGSTQTKRLTIQTAEDILYKPFFCLDHGFVRLIDYQGGDSRIVQAARVSYAKGTKTLNEDKGLIRYLMRNAHTTPFEMVEMTFHAKLPIFVARQWIRHRTASVNEMSGRYSIMPEEFYTPNPEDLGNQSKSNKQGRGDSITPEKANKIIEILREDALHSFSNYRHLLNEDPQNLGSPINPEEPRLARELARIGLPLSTYTEWYWKTDLHNLFHFLKLRKNEHAQKEIRVYAEAMSEMTKAVAPLAYEAFENYRLNSINLSEKDIRGINLVSSGEDALRVSQSLFDNKREGAEFLGKVKMLIK